MRKLGLEFAGQISEGFGFAIYSFIRKTKKMLKSDVARPTQRWSYAARVNNER